MANNPTNGPWWSRRAVMAQAAACVIAGPAAADAARLPDGEETRHAGWRAWLTHPTDRYDHGVLGDAIEAGGFAVEAGARVLAHVLGRDAVFEDRRVRLADIDRDGRPEALVVKSYLDRGAALALYRIGPTQIEPLAESAAIGVRHRWLNPIGVADFTGSGEPMIAAVVTPHLAGSLRLYRRDGQRLVETARIDGFTNHIIGHRDLDLGRILPSTAGPSEVLLPSLDRRALARLSFAGGAARVIARQPFDRRIVALAPLSADRVTVTFEDGTRAPVAVPR